MEMRDELPLPECANTTEHRRAERLTSIVAVVALACCLGALFASCGGDDIIIGGMLLPTTATGATPTETP